MARAIIAVLDTRGIDLPAFARERIVTCIDGDTLGLRLRRAAVVDSVEVVFGDS
ncbi:hypothetical protein [Nocardiopsis suaedae]|uniref:Uncharacterized protein n=1 Tax=Nocardiopsis suaedae TaxID=3018444 RepID=A0ABT4TI56_9ACTN|nr:hypothetical protein [Nocardiopsis suaedae]MDA2804095.1 hypothetical protein [Nocardiopsis suaedae]